MSQQQNELTVDIKAHSCLSFMLSIKQKENLSLSFRQFFMDSRKLWVCKLVSAPYEYFFLNDWNYD